MIPCKDPNRLNFWLNHSKIYPSITRDGDPEYLDASGLLKKEGTYFFNFPYGCLLFFKDFDNVFKGDIYFLPRNRGAKAKKAAEDCIYYMFSEGATKIIAEAPDFNKPSQRFIRSLGFNRQKVMPNAWQKNGKAHDIIVYEKAH